MKSTGRILIVGVGGLGVPAACALARAGASRITLIDPDPVELSNLARQVIYRDTDIGKPKAEVAGVRLREAFPDREITTHVGTFDSRSAVNLVSTHEFLIDATDDPATKFLINDTALEARRPFVYGGVLAMAGQAMTIVPGRTACLRCLFETAPDPDEVASCREAGIIGPVAGVIGEIQAAEAIASLSGAMPRLAGRILTYDAARSARFRVTEVPIRTGCKCEAVRRDSAAASVHQ
ncbi:MAG TPA: ThiF family adenylyltransferase [Candidatus Binataceae bacterium]|nr:ThiF family adenylyltransferase [Candidatus Binataceae bacterium]